MWCSHLVKSRLIASSNIKEEVLEIIPTIIPAVWVSPADV